jgi:hypothetical protein
VGINQPRQDPETRTVDRIRFRHGGGILRRNDSQYFIALYNKIECTIDSCRWIYQASAFENPPLH